MQSWSHNYYNILCSSSYKFKDQAILDVKEQGIPSPDDIGVITELTDKASVYAFIYYSKIRYIAFLN